MHKGLNNFIDVCEGLPLGTTNKRILKERKRQGHHH